MKALKKKPIQIYIENQQDYVLAALARSKGASKAEIIRECLDKYLREIPLKDDPAIELIGLGNSGKKDLSERHDAYLVQYARRKKK
jgi:hypothetical protein